MDAKHLGILIQHNLVTVKVDKEEHTGGNGHVGKPLTTLRTLTTEVNDLPAGSKLVVFGDSALVPAEDVEGLVEVIIGHLELLDTSGLDTHTKKILGRRREHVLASVAEAQGVLLVVVGVLRQPVVSAQREGLLDARGLPHTGQLLSNSGGVLDLIGVVQDLIDILSISALNTLEVSGLELVILGDGDKVLKSLQRVKTKELDAQLDVGKVELSGVDGAGLEEEGRLARLTSTKEENGEGPLGHETLALELLIDGSGLVATAGHVAKSLGDAVALAVNTGLLGGKEESHLRRVLEVEIDETLHHFHVLLLDLIEERVGHKGVNLDQHVVNSPLRKVNLLVATGLDVSAEDLTSDTGVLDLGGLEFLHSAVEVKKLNGRLVLKEGAEEVDVVIKKKILKNLSVVSVTTNKLGIATKALNISGDADGADELLSGPVDDGHEGTRPDNENEDTEDLNTKLLESSTVEEASVLIEETGGYGTPDTRKSVHGDGIKRIIDVEAVQEEGSGDREDQTSNETGEDGIHSGNGGARTSHGDQTSEERVEHGKHIVTTEHKLGEDHRHEHGGDGTEEGVDGALDSNLPATIEDGRGTSVEEEPADEQDPGTDGGLRRKTLLHLNGKTSHFVEATDTGTKKHTTDETANTTNHVDDGGTSEINVTHGAEESTSVPDPMARNRVHEEADAEGRDKVGGQGDTLGNDTRIDGGAGGSEGKLEDEVKTIIVHTRGEEQVLSDEGTDRVTVGSTITEQKPRERTEHKIGTVLHNNRLLVSGTHGTDLKGRETALHKKDKDGRDECPLSADGTAGIKEEVLNVEGTILIVVPVI
jgi:hypothetical protein